MNFLEGFNQSFFPVLLQKLQEDNRRKQLEDAQSNLTNELNPYVNVPAPTAQVPNSTMVMRGVPTTERQPVGYGSPQMVQALQHYLTSTGQGMDLGGLLKLQELGQPKYSNVGVAGNLVTTRQMGGGQPTVVGNYAPPRTAQQIEEENRKKAEFASNEKIKQEQLALTAQQRQWTPTQYTDPTTKEVKLGAWEFKKAGSPPIFHTSDELAAPKLSSGGGKLPKTVQSAYDMGQEADQIAERMKQDVALGNAGNPQADQDMLARHLSLTFGQGIKGMRINKDLIEQHQKARGLPEDFSVLAAKIQRGETLSPQQRERMYELGLMARESAWKTYYRKAIDNGVDLEPTKSELLPPIMNPYKKNQSGGTIHFKEGGDSYDIPQDKIQKFKQLHPNAVQQ